MGLARVCITPEEPVWLYGYAGKNRFRPFAGVLDDDPRQGPGRRGPARREGRADHGRPVRPAPAGGSAARKRIMDKTGLARRQILLNWSHTHSGPMLGDSDVNRYPISAEDRRRTMAYTEQLADKLAGGGCGGAWPT